jgi:LemA protein
MLWVIVALGAVIVAAIIGYNQLARLRLLADNAWADIDVQLKRRHELVPNLVAAVQGHAGYERTTLESVVAARGKAMAAASPGASGEAEGVLASGVRQILALAEAYPDLKAAESFLSLQRNLSEIEEHLQQARRYYNAVVRDLNTRVEQFPSSLVARLFGFGPREFFGLADSSEAAVPAIDLGKR